MNRPAQPPFPAALVGLFAVLVSTLNACGSGGGASPTAPTAQATLTPLIIAGAPDLLIVGETAALSAQGTWTDGVTRVVSLQWSSDAAAVLSVDNGAVVARGAGVATITVLSGAATATARIRVVPVVNGGWSGSVRYPSCSVPARWGSGFCPSTGVSFSATLDLVQQRDAVVGTLNAGRSGTVRGTVRTDGSLVLTGQLTSVAGTRTLRFDLRDWQTSLASDGSLRGQWAEVITWVGESGQGLLEVEIIRVTKR